MAHRHDIAARLIDAAMDDALGIEPCGGALHRLGIELVLEDVVGLDQQRRARARQQVAVRIGGMAHADMAEGIDHALVGQDAVGNGEFLDEIGHIIRHGRSSYGGSVWPAAFGGPNKSATGRLRNPCAVRAGDAIPSEEKRFPGQE